jgi:hypothetical protein
MADRGAIERVGRGRWRIAAFEPEPELEPELQPINPRALDPGAGVQSRWIKPLSCYERRETTIVEGLRYG